MSVPVNENKSQLQEILVTSSEKAARVARICREDPLLFRLLVQKKQKGEANPRFVEDFKTLADVLVQELVKKDVVDTFPELSFSIEGEESNVFENQLGESIKVEIKGLPEDTAVLLEIVLSGDDVAAERLAAAVHREVAFSEVNTAPVPHFEIDVVSLGIWIDPIDATSEYIDGKEVVLKEGIYVGGLRCATVLIGVYDRITGAPVFGVINQPFSVLEDKGWKGECFWGVHTPIISTSSISLSSAPTPSTHTHRVTLSSSEDKAIKTKLEAAGFTLIEAAGAGYKILTVIKGITDAYVLSKDTTYKWDTCAPHAILKAIGGGIVEFKAALGGVVNELAYAVEGEEAGGKLGRCCNAGGIIAYRSEGVLERILKALA